MLERFDQPVRCAAGHLFTTIWVPFASVKAVRLGQGRYQRCPVGAHWSTVVRIDPSSASPDELRQAASVHDAQIP